MFCVDTDDTKALYDWGWTNGQTSEIHQGCNNMRIIINKAEINLKQIEHEHVLYKALIKFELTEWSQNFHTKSVTTKLHSRCTQRGGPRYPQF